MIDPRTIALVLLGLPLNSCGRPVNPSDVPGAYVMNQGQAADTLVVAVDGQYRRVYAMPGSAPVIDTGHWTFDTADGRLAVTFAGFTPRWRAETFPSRPPVTGYWLVEPERTASGIRFVVDDDDAWAYVQIRARD